MNNMTLLECMNTIPLEWVEECESDRLPKSPKVLPIAAASTLCVCGAAGVLFACGAFDRKPTVITPENSIGTYVCASLARAPYPGEMWYSMWLGSDIGNRESTDDLVYCVEIRFSDEHEDINMNQEKTKVE